MIRVLTIAALLLLLCSLPAQAVPDAEHLRLSCQLMRLNLNNEVLRHQIKLNVRVTRSDAASLAGIEDSFARIANPAGVVVRLKPSSVQTGEKRFKAASAVLVFRAVEDSADESVSNVPLGFFTSPGPYSVELVVEDQLYRGEVSFKQQIEMRARQAGEPVRNTTLKDEEPLEILTIPAEFGPVYYRQQDRTNFVFQMANIDDAISSGNFHAPRENPVYVLQVRVSDGKGGPARLLDPADYIEGFQPHMIRSERTSTPISFEAGTFDDGEVAVIDFVRDESFEPDSVFSGPEGFSSDLVVRERIVFAFGVEGIPDVDEIVPPDPQLEAEAVTEQQKLIEETEGEIDRW